MIKSDVIIIGAGASGLICAIEAAKRGRKVTLLDHSDRPGRKILASGGGRCNFTNYDVEPHHFISQNPHFCKSSLSRYSQWSFLEMVGEYHIRFHEREHGQLFCDHSASEILDMLLDQCSKKGVYIQSGIDIKGVERERSGAFTLSTNKGQYSCASLVIATGGLSMTNLGASDLGYQLAKQFGHNIIPTSPGLVPFTLNKHDKELLSPLSGIAIKSTVECKDVAFTENLLFTHRGLSGPVILQISNYWQPGDAITVNLLSDIDLVETIVEARNENGKRQLNSMLQELLPKRLVATLLDNRLATRTLGSLSTKEVEQVGDIFQRWKLLPAGTEGYKTAEVTSGGINTNEISSKTMESRKVSGLYFTGEVLDVTGWLGGYNLQWAWSSGWCAGQYV